MYVIGTAGHVDHGKSTLIEALTGIDPDRLREEKERGMTIDLGFAWMKLRDGSEASIVDVPGHERFIKNMLAGVSGIDLALLVVAADEGVMPQTLEHLAILDLLAIDQALIVITKADTVDAEWMELVKDDILEAVAGTTLEDSPLVVCSAVSGEGLPELRAAIEAALAKAPLKRDLGRPRLPIDRAFTVVGAGTVVTGTLTDGALQVGDSVEVLPSYVGGHLTALRGRIRGLQMHRSKVDRALPGTRTAVNLVGLEPSQLSRGQVLALPGILQPSIAVDVHLKAISYLMRPIRHNLHITFHCLSSEVPGRLRLLERDALAPGEATWAQILLSEPVAVLKGDRFVIRDANQTLGGGVILETQARRHGRGREDVIGGLRLQMEGRPGSVLLAEIARLEPCSLGEACAQTPLDDASAQRGLEELLAEGLVVRLGEAGQLITQAGLSRAREKFEAAVRSFLQRNPLAQGIAREEARSQLGYDRNEFNDLLALFLNEGLLTETEVSISLPGWTPRLSPVEEKQADAYLATLRESPYSPPTENRIDKDLMTYLITSGAVVDVGGGVVFVREAFDAMSAAVIAVLQEKGTISLPEVRDLFATSRRYAQFLLEYLDAKRLTRRRGDEHVPGPAFAASPREERAAQLTVDAPGC